MKNKFENKITFFTQTLGRTGSEIALFNLLINLDSRFNATLITKYKITTLTIPPPIKIDYLYLIPSKKLIDRILYRLLKMVKLAKYKNSIWYVNTIVMPEIIEYAKKNKVRLILHVHELEQMYESLSSQQIQNIVSCPDLIIANSKASERVLNKYGRKDRIKICYPSIDTSLIKKHNDIRIEYRNHLNIKPEEFVWIMSGTLDENKNPILFIEIANELAKLNPNILFIWIGQIQNRELEKICNQKVSSLGLNNKIKWIFNAGSDYYNYFNCADGFVLTSKKESFSLVTIEALLFSLPIVAQDCEGVKEILQQDIGKIVKQKNDAEVMANEMLKFMNGEYIVNKELQTQRACEFDISIWATKWNNILLDYFQEL